MYSPEPKLRVYSVVVGINHYQNGGTTQLPDLRFAVRDAWRVAGNLRAGNARIEPDLDGSRTKVFLYNQATSTNIRNALRGFLTLPTLTRNNIVLFYFAGHGLNPPGRDDGYLCCYDCDPQNPDNGSIRFSELYLQVGGAPSDAAVVVALDACYSGGVMDVNLVGRDPISQIKNIINRGALVGNGPRAILAAAQSYQAAREDPDLDPMQVTDSKGQTTTESGAGRFTSALIRGWFLGEACDPRTGSISLLSLVSYIQQHVGRVAPQNSTQAVNQVAWRGPEQEPVAAYNGADLQVGLVNLQQAGLARTGRTETGSAPVPLPPGPRKPPWKLIGATAGGAVVLVTLCSVLTLVSSVAFAIWFTVAALAAVASVPASALLARILVWLTVPFALAQLVLLAGLAHARFGWGHGIGFLGAIAQFGWVALVIFLIQTIGIVFTVGVFVSIIGYF